MKINLDETEVLNLLTAVRSEFINSKAYYESYKDEEKRIGVTSPDEWKSLYNSILNQAHDNERLTLLEIIK